MKATISLGSNVEPRASFLKRALEELEALPDTKVVDVSEVIETEPVDAPIQFAGQKFLNQVAFLSTDLEVHDFSRRMHAIEDRLGRVRTIKNGPRTIDIDLIAFGDLVINEPTLTLPHPRAISRDFVMYPLRELRRRELRRHYDEYVAGYRAENGKLPELMQLKYTHTMAVVENAKRIADGEIFDNAARHVALSAALLHDTGRYEQLRLYNTFRDSDSIDHAVFSHRIVGERGWLGDWESTEREPVLAAVLYHNRRDLPENLDNLTLTAAQTVRDADKLDIFRILETLVKTTDWRNDSRAFWNLKTGLSPNPAVVSAIRERQPVDYQNIKSLADFVLIQIGWMISGIYYATSRRLCRERGHLAFRKAFLQEIGGGSVANDLCEMAEKVL